MTRARIPSHKSFRQARLCTDAVLDRLVNNAYWISLSGESMRRKPSPLPQTGQAGG